MAIPSKYTWEEKKQILVRTLPPENITKAALYKWKERLNKEQPLSNKPVKNWSSEDKFHIVLEIYPMSEADFGAYCRTKGLYVEQVKEWQKSCLTANGKSNTVDSKKVQLELKEERQKS